jgi:LysM repeat protein/uncharacterized protein YvpB
MRALRDLRTGSSQSARPAMAAAVGASCSFDPGADGMAGIYASRLLDRGLDPRAVCADVRADRLGNSESGVASRSHVRRIRVSRFGRGTGPHLQAMSLVQREPAKLNRPRIAVPKITGFGRSSRQPTLRWSRRLAAAGLALLLLLPVGAIAAGAQEVPAQSRYIVQEGDTLESVAAEFGVDPAAILAASALQNPPYLTPTEVIIIPDPSETPETAAWNASQREGSSPFVVGAHDVAPGETIASISATYGIDPWAFALFNGIDNVDALSAGQRLRVPLTDFATSPTDAWSGELYSADVPALEAASDESVGGPVETWEAPASEPVFAADVPAYMQMYSLSCEYAAAFIATSAFGAGVPEAAFLERIGPSANPHWGYRGSIDGPWGGTDDYGVYAEALVPTLTEFGFVADVFYGGDPASLTARLDAGMPVITWLGYFGDTAWQQSDEGSYILAPGMHVVTVYGYDEGGVYLSNPGRGIYDYYAWDDFLAKWAVLDGMALAVAPM